MKSKSIAFLFIALIVISVINYVAFAGVEMFGYKYYGVMDKEHGIKQGIDLAGGSVITFRAEKEEVTADEMKVVEGVMRRRLDASGYTEGRITVGQLDSRNITVEIPAVTDVEEAVKLLGKTAKLTFQDSDGKVVLDGATDVKTAKDAFGPIGADGASENYIQLELTKSGIPKFFEATGAAAKKAEGENYISIVLDDKIISSPRVKEAINADTAIISGSFTQTDAALLASQIKSGQLPFNLVVEEKNIVGAELGDKALSTSVLAGLIGVLLVMVFMIFFYRVSGLVASVALVCYIGVFALIMGAFQVNLSLPGIAGVILSIGMAVDANVVIFERMKEELRLGKTIKASVDSGFKRALSAILDSNITTLIAAGVLWYFGTGPIKGFAITLLIGVALSMVTAIVVTKSLLKQVIGLNLTNPVLYGVKKSKGVSENA